MVDIGVNTVDTDSVHSEHLHEGGISKAGVLVRQRILSSIWVKACAATRLIGNTNDLVPIACSIVDKVAALDVNGRHSSGQRGGTEETQDTSRDLW